MALSLPRSKILMAAHAAQLHFCVHPPKTQEEIAKLFGVDKATVSRLISYAREKQMLTFSTNLPREQNLESELVRTFGLTDAYVVPIVPAQDERDIGLFRRLLGQAAARYIESSELVKNGYRVGIGCGATMREVILALTTGRFSGVHIHQLTVETDCEEVIDESPFALVGMLYARWRIGSYAYAIQPLPKTLVKADGTYTTDYLPYHQYIQEQFGNLHTVIMGIGSANIASGDGSFSRLCANCRIHPRVLRRAGVVGELCNHPYDRSGNDLFSVLKNKQQSLSHFTDGIDLSQLQQLVSHNARVIAVAGGIDKVEAIRTVLSCRMVNHLVTDDSTAEALCKSI